MGGAKKFRDNGGDQSAVATWLQAAGYATGFVGKYMNQYDSISPFTRAVSSSAAPRA